MAYVHERVAAYGSKHCRFASHVRHSSSNIGVWLWLLCLLTNCVSVGFLCFMVFVAICVAFTLSVPRPQQKSAFHLSDFHLSACPALIFSLTMMCFAIFFSGQPGLQVKIKTIWYKQLHSWVLLINVKEKKIRQSKTLLEMYLYECCMYRNDLFSGKWISN